jgi:L-malate glycosyltransferase
MALFFAILIAHTINWVFNGQIPVALKCCDLLHHTAARYEEKVANITRCVSNRSDIKLAIIFGSRARGQCKESSDLDIRLIRKSGLIKALSICTFVAIERTKALVELFPLDIYIWDNDAKLNSMAEPPMVIFELR